MLCKTFFEALVVKRGVKNDKQRQVWWYMLIISALGRQGQEDLEFKASLGYIVRS
jgi:hypothetical protein